MIPAQPAPQRLGLLGEDFDPAAQLLEDLPEDDRTVYQSITDPSDEADYFDRLLVLSQDYALAHLPGLVECGKPCQILLRRTRLAADVAVWADGLRLLSDALTAADAPHISLVALTEAAASEIGGTINKTVGVLGRLGRIPGQRPTVPVRRDDPMITFSQTAIDGSRETRRARLTAFSWVRLRRLGHLFAADPDDMDMVDLVSFAEGVDGEPTPTERSGPPCMIVVVPNGVGLGHVTRMMAIGKALNKKERFRVVFWCFSRAAAIVQAAGFEVILRQNAVHLDAHPPDWRWWETFEFAKILRQIRPDIIAYDGAAFDAFLINALRTPGCGRSGVLWVRRGMMRPETDISVLDPEQYSDLVLEPGDLAVEADRGPTRMAKAEFQGFSRTFVAPSITLKPFLPEYRRRDALKRLGLKRGRYCLVSLGGAFGNWDELLWNIKEHSRRNGIRLVWAQSPLSPPPDDTGDGTIIRQFYPLSPYLEAFSGIITATGYNSFHELMIGYEGPVLLAPTNLERLDDQVARATYAKSRGWADVLFANKPEDHGAIIADFMKQLRKGHRVLGRPGEFEDQSDMVDAVHSVRRTYLR